MSRASKGISNYLLKENAKLKRSRKEIKECTVKLDVLKNNRTNLQSRSNATDNIDSKGNRQEDIEEEKM